MNAGASYNERFLSNEIIRTWHDSIFSPAGAQDASERCGSLIYSSASGALAQPAALNSSNRIALDSVLEVGPLASSCHMQTRCCTNWSRNSRYVFHCVTFSFSQQIPVFQHRKQSTLLLVGTKTCQTAQLPLACIIGLFHRLYDDGALVDLFYYPYIALFIFVCVCVCMNDPMNRTEWLY